VTLATPPSGTPEPPTPIIASPITWTQLGVILIIVVPLISAVYVGIHDGQIETNKRLDSLQQTIEKAIPVLSNAPKLEETIAKAHDDVIVLQESIKPLNQLPGQVQSMQVQLNNIQTQIHTIPGVKR
jgi:uncharacterized protein HemX